MEELLDATPTSSSCAHRGTDGEIKQALLGIPAPDLRAVKNDAVHAAVQLRRA